MADSGAGSLLRCTEAEVAEEKGKKRAGSELAAEAPKLMAAEVGTEVEEEDDGVTAQEATTAAGKKDKKWRVPQDLIDFILAWDVSEYVFVSPDNMDDMDCFTDEHKASYRARRKEIAAFMQQRRRTRKKMQDWVKAELERHGYVEIETTAEMLEKHQLEEYISGQIE